MAKKLTAAALTEMVTALRDKISGAKYMVGGQWRETAVTSCEIGTDGKLYVGLMLQPTAAEIVTQVALQLIVSVMMAPSFSVSKKPTCRGLPVIQTTITVRSRLKSPTAPEVDSGLSVMRQWKA